MISLAEPLDHARACFGDRVAVIDGARRLSYRDLADRCARLAGGLASFGFEHGDRVALLAANGHRYLEAFFAVPAAGLVLVPLNTRLAHPELAHIVAHSGARVLITDRDPGGLRSCVEQVITIDDDYERLLAGADTRTVANVSPDDVAAIFYTGGTTGLPKGVTLTHR